MNKNKIVVTGGYGRFGKVLNQINNSLNIY